MPLSVHGRPAGRGSRIEAQVPTCNDETLDSKLLASVLDVICCYSIELWNSLVREARFV
jgi:hypothetical protein